MTHNSTDGGKKCCGACAKTEQILLTSDRNRSMGIAGTYITKCVDVRCSCHTTPTTSPEEEKCGLKVCEIISSILKEKTHHPRCSEYDLSLTTPKDNKPQSEKKPFKESLADLIKVQSKQDPTSPYMVGMANGLICAWAVLTGEEPKYLNVIELKDERRIEHVDTTSNNGWEERSFEKFILWSNRLKMAEAYGSDKKIIEVHTGIKSFISTLLTAERERGYKQCEEEMSGKNPRDFGYNEGRVQTLSKVKEMIRGIIEKLGERDDMGAQFVRKSYAVLSNKLDKEI